MFTNNSCSSLYVHKQQLQFFVCSQTAAAVLCMFTNSSCSSLYVHKQQLQFFVCSQTAAAVLCMFTNSSCSSLYVHKQQLQFFVCSQTAAAVLCMFTNSSCSSLYVHKPIMFTNSSYSFGNSHPSDTSEIKSSQICACMNSSSPFFCQVLFKFRYEKKCNTNGGILKCPLSIFIFYFYDTLCKLFW